MIRHGQTDWNAELRMQGQKDIPLNTLGRAQATGNGRALKAILGDSVDAYDFVASPLSRTRETMERLRAAMGLDPQAYRTDERLVELNFGDWEGHTLAELELFWPDRLKARMQGKWDFIPPGTDAESYEILSWRVGSWLRSVTGPTVCVSHGGVMRSVLRLVGGHSGDEAAETNIRQDQILEVDAAAGRVTWLAGAAGTA
jgi:probable phosphoglycerate mutase